MGDSKNASETSYAMSRGTGVELAVATLLRHAVWELTLKAFQVQWNNNLILKVVLPTK